MIQEETEDVVAKAPARGRLARAPASCGPRKWAAARAASCGLRVVGRTENLFSFSKELVNNFLI